MSEAQKFRDKFKKAAKAVVAPDPMATLLARVRSLMAAGVPDFDICSELDIDTDMLVNAKRIILEAESQYIKDQKPIEVYLEYRFVMHKICDDLDFVHEGAKEARQFTAAMGALKAKAQIMDKVMDRGQDMGVIPRAATKIRHELAVSGMSDEQLLQNMKTISVKTDSLVREYGDFNIQDVSVPPIYVDVDEKR